LYAATIFSLQVFLSTHGESGSCILPSTESVSDTPKSNMKIIHQKANPLIPSKIPAIFFVVVTLAHCSIEITSTQAKYNDIDRQL